MTDNKIDVTVSIEFHDDGNVSLTFGPVAPDAVTGLLQYVGTDEFADNLIDALDGGVR